MNRSFLWHAVAAVLVASCFSELAAAGQRYVDDCKQAPSPWRRGDVPAPIQAAGMAFSVPHRTEGTLLGTTMNPANLKTFSASFRWTFGKTGKPSLQIGWAKPFEWSRFDQCPVLLQIEQDGRAVLRVQRKTIGVWRLPVSSKGGYALKITQEANRVVLQSGTAEKSCDLPAGYACQPGYMAIHLQGANGANATVRSVEIEASGDEPPMTTADRHAEIQRWARSQMKEDGEMLARLKEYLKAETAAGRWGYKTSLEVSPGLVRTGETTTAVFHVAGAVPSPCEATVAWNYLRSTPERPQPLTLDWKPDGQGGFAARVDLTPKQPGNAQIVWRVGQEEISRMFGAIDDGWAVCRLLVTSYKGLRRHDRSGEAYDVIHQHGLAADFWDGSEHVAPYVRTPERLADEYRVFAVMRHRFGDHFMPMCHGNYMLSQCPNTNLFWFDADVQHDGIRQLMEVWNQLGLGPMDLLGSYTYSHDTPQIARSLGIKAIDSLVEWQNWRDGGDDSAWLINQWAAPNVPYYVAADDYRKVSPGRSIVALPQTTTSDVRAYSIMTSEGQPQLVGMRQHSRPPEAGETSNIDRFEAVVDLWLAEASRQREPLFFFVGLEDFCDLVDWDHANTLGVNYLREQAKDKNLVFVSGVDIADFFTRHYEKQPENWVFWPDTYCGYRHAYKPALLPDRIELTNAEFHSLHQLGEALPQFFWDFTRPWHEPVWDDQAAIRKKFGLCDLTQLTADNCVPHMVNLEGVKADVKMGKTSDGAAIKVEIDSPKPIARLPIAVWNIPLKADGAKAAKTSDAARFVAITDGATGNLHGLIVCDNIAAGTNIRTVQLQGTPREPIDPTFQLGADIAGRVFLRGGRTYVYLWKAASPGVDGVLTIRVPNGRTAVVHYNDGKTEAAKDGLLQVAFDRCWATQSPMIVGLTKDELIANAAFKPAAGVVPKK